jgi:hypothetical protein
MNGMGKYWSCCEGKEKKGEHYKLGDLHCWIWCVLVNYLSIVSRCWCGERMHREHGFIGEKAFRLFFTIN